MKRILILRGGALGDFILGLPALRAVRRAFPDAHLELVAPSTVLPLAKRCVDVATPLERAETAQLFREEGLPEGAIDRYRDLDLAILWIADASGVVRRNFQRLGVGQILWAPALPQQPGRHATDHLLDSLRPLGIKTTGQGDPNEPRIWPPLACQDWPNQRVNITQTEAVIAVHPGSGGAWKCWLAECFARLIEQLQASGRRLVLVQGPADSAAVEGVITACRTEPPPTLSGLDIEDLAAFLSSCACYVGNDSGVTHLAAAVGTPTVALFGPTDPTVWGPRGAKVKVIYSHQLCSPCNREKATACQPRVCLESITVQQVISTIEEVLV